jgi:hypothetical protein
MVHSQNRLRSAARRWPGSGKWLLAVLFAAMTAEVACGKEDAVGGKYTATAFLRVEQRDPRVTGPLAPFDSVDAFAIYKNTQAVYVKCRPVLNAALGKPEIQKLGILKGRADPVAWLAEQLHVDFPGKAELMTVSLTADDAVETAALLNAVVDAYMRVVVGKGKSDPKERLAEIERAAAENESLLRDKSEKLMRLIHQFEQSGIEVVFPTRQIAADKLAELRRDLSDLNREFRRASVDRLMQQAMLGRGITVSNAEIDAAAKSDPMIARVFVPALVQVNKDLLAAETQEPVDRQAVGKLNTKSKVIADHIEKRRVELRDVLLQRKQAVMEEEIQRLEIRTKILEHMVEVRAKNVEDLRRTNAEVEIRKAEVDSLEQFVKKLAEEKQSLLIAIRAPSRVTVIQRAESPESNGEARRVAKPKD